ncbi:response regulator transcription factor [Neobacillus sp. SM06]|uniref:response regulator transcription factor n=1 Tax=Neobacillus sp. SM06 TaxID=3422492 RepID=UPI003D2DFBF9
MEGKKLRGKTILIVDDHEPTRAALKKALSANGFEVLEAIDANKGFEQYEKHDPCFVVQELKLPDLDGFEFCRQLRGTYSSNVPIIILSARNSQSDRIEGLRVGADDYMGKPFDLEELIARIEAVLRRTANRCSKLSYRELTIKPLQAAVKYLDAELELTQFEYKLLYQFMTHPNQILSRAQIISQIYEKGEKFINDRTIDVHVKHLREKIAKLTNYPFIVTIRGIGYKFNTENEAERCLDE